MSVGVLMYIFPLEAKHDPCPGVKITGNEQDRWLCQGIDWHSDRSRDYTLSRRRACMCGSLGFPSIK